MLHMLQDEIPLSEQDTILILTHQNHQASILERNCSHLLFRCLLVFELNQTSQDHFEFLPCMERTELAVMPFTKPAGFFLEEIQQYKMALCKMVHTHCCQACVR